MRLYLKIAALGLLLALIWLAYSLTQMTKYLAVNHRSHAGSHTVIVGNIIETACLNYMVEYNQLPPASDNKTLTAALFGDNSRHIPFLSLPQNDMNSDHEVVDEWGTPFRINLQGKSGIKVISAGLDKVFGTGDDISSTTSDKQ